MITGRSIEQTSFYGNYYNTMYEYTISSTNVNSSVAEKQNDMLIQSENYWLASRCVKSEGARTTFAVREVKSDGSVGILGVCGCENENWNINEHTKAIRAVVVLQSGIQTSDVTYNSSTGWNLSV